jgi:hypothetical protein
MTSEATAAKDAASATTTFSLKPQHAEGPNVMLVFRYGGGPTAFQAAASLAAMCACG